ncbi:MULTISPECIES: UDP-N-acetylmuramoyl-L-alanine--D-glutamate ligase [unclassified Variovorax]|uniref:Mur ligase family protein n=1 Tax=unclassified Variovorax TaxID=663243 RepID=UPI0008392710|nr:MULTISPECIES: UDP-N-acetylmuramoyl-L-alanine--D-glutamate ligase [unclassified Variovorax]PNG59666.1 UDP-N-acetylmuramoylalanine--D-glutamate ligase [Variovorax sp. B4]PNG60543.1 UDP-N-acetylmuramoylalanine--D-glutamate ligase [Variovorax sp. B2]VTV13572.1 UDP-N-acetylmuramoylalanine--D-glutamate ligase [Variovorax sp. WDL1]
MRHLQDQHVLILGLGASGLAMARWCARHAAKITVADTREAPPQLEALRSELPDAVFVGGPFSAALVEGTAVRAVYRSPGLSPASVAVVVDAAKAIGLPVGGELDLFAHALVDLRVPERAAEPAPPAEPEATLAQEPLQPTDALHATEARESLEVLEVREVPETLQAEETPAANEPQLAAESEPEPAPVEDDDDAEASTPVPVPVPPAPKGYEPAVLAVTGTNGKTTVTALTGQLVARAGKTVAVAGNIGPTLLDTLAAHIDAGTLPEVWVLELSSFQLDGVQGFEPTAATVLNITQDHLDWHGDMAAYAAAKARIFGTRSIMVLNREDDAVMAMSSAGPSQAAKAPSAGSDDASARSVGARRPAPVKLAKGQAPRPVVTFGAGMPLRPGDYGVERVHGMAWLVRALEADETQKRKRGAAVEEEEIHIQRLMPADALRIRGRHNALNALAALALATAAGCQLGPMLYGLREYRGEPHRVEPVTIVDDVEFFDDSKGTNVGATVAALGGLGEERRVVVILGGEGKGQDFAPLAAPVRQYARAVVLIGRDASLIEAALASTGVPLLHAASMEEAVKAAAGRAHPGDAVLLSPACASFDMFKDYAHRAAVFCEAVQDWAESPRGVDAGLPGGGGA